MFVIYWEGTHGNVGSSDVDTQTVSNHQQHFDVFINRFLVFTLFVLFSQSCPYRLIFYVYIVDNRVKEKAYHEQDIHDVHASN